MRARQHPSHLEKTTIHLTFSPVTKAPEQDFTDFTDFIGPTLFPRLWRTALDRLALAGGYT